eukprot:TRINITY_DN12894_c0_g1_i5.p1 TRINITY_DN12894_c0_g1~~TRINITY_DN12894_c0_g1_i5.p1  ORF type:complete len:144 (-),score=13.18 TRINITY_DN12894_c0_g1_i5:118-549(-)
MDSMNVVQSSGASIWMGLGPPRVEAFCWLAVAGKISTADILRRRGFTSGSDTCCFCRRERESIDYLFIQCDVASFIWGYFLKVSGVSCRFCLRSGIGPLWSVLGGSYGGSFLYPSFGQFGKREMIEFLIENNQQGRILCQLCF